MIRLVNAQYLPEENGDSVAVISTELGLFHGIARLHEDDRDVESEFIGCHIAESKAYIKYIKEKIKILTHQIKALENYENLIKNLKEYQPHSRENRKLRRMIFELKQERVNWRKSIETLNKANNEICEEKRRMLKRINDKKKGDNNQ